MAAQVGDKEVMFSGTIVMDGNEDQFTVSEGGVTLEVRFDQEGTQGGVGGNDARKLLLVLAPRERPKSDIIYLAGGIEDYQVIVLVQWFDFYKLVAYRVSAA
jgi:hypothetical protein